MIIAVVGTDTGIGKTWVTCNLAERLRAFGCTVSARKPVQSFESEPTDATLLATATGEDSEVVCPPMWSFPVPMAPPMAIDVLGKPLLQVSDLIDWVTTSITASAPQVTLVELVGGVCSPQAHDADGLIMLHLLRPDMVLLVALAGLGTLNAVRLSMRALQSSDCLPALRPVVVLNQFDPENDLHTRNLAWLVGQDGYDVIAATSTGLFQLTKCITQAVPSAGLLH